MGLAFNIVRWYRIALNGWPIDNDALPQIVQHGQFSVSPIGRATPVHLHMPNMVVTSAGRLAFVMERSSQAETQSLQIAGGLPSITMPLHTAIASLSDRVTNDTDRWGDYSDMAYDISDGSVWAIGEYQVLPLVADAEKEKDHFPGHPKDGWWSTRVINFRA
jgi:hypothetical protein